MKKLLCAFIAALTLALCLASCSGGNTGETTAAPETTTKSNIPTIPAETYTNAVTLKGAEPDGGKIDFVYEDYYYYSNTVAKITGVTVEDDALGGILGLADVQITALDKFDSELYIGYTAYDKDGNVVRDLFLLVNLTDAGVKEGSVIEGRRFDLPYGTTKVVFHNYTDK